MDSTKSMVFKQIMNSLAQELGTQIRFGHQLFGHTPRLQELRQKSGEDPYEPLPGITYVHHVQNETPIIVGPFRTKEEPIIPAELIEPQKALPEWHTYYEHLIALTIKHANIACKQETSQAQTPGQAKLLLAFWHSVRDAKTIEGALKRTLEFLVYKFHIGNVCIVVHGARADYFDLNHACRQAEGRILSHLRDARTIVRIQDARKDIILADIKDKEHLPNTMTAFPLVQNRELIGYALCLGDSTPSIEGVSSVLLEFLSLLGKLTEFEQVQESAITDALTGLFNRAQLTHKLEKLVNELRSEAKPLSVMMLDADNFKKYNDTHGHPEGDKALVAIAKIIKSVSPDNALCARYGGEEFLIAVPELDHKDAREFAEHLREQLQTQTPLTCSIGLMTCVNSSASRITMVKLADEALYRAKNLGKNKVVQKIMLDKNLGVIDA